MGIEGISHVTFVVRDLERMARLLCDGLGAREVYDSGRRTYSLSPEKFFLLGGTWIAAMQGEAPAARSYGHVAFKVAPTDLPLYEARLRALGVEVKPPRPRVEGEGESLYFHDFDNHLFELHTGTLEERLQRYGADAAAEVAAAGDTAQRPHRIVVFGNSGSGKSTLAARLAKRDGLTHLDLDSIVWEPGKIAVPRAPEAIAASLQHFIASHEQWVIEGCYGELVEAAAGACTELVFLNPGKEACLANNLRRPWEPHKYATPQAQDEMLANLQAWVAGYYEREDAWSYRAHRRIFEAFGGPKAEHVAPVPD